MRRKPIPEVFLSVNHCVFIRVTDNSRWHVFESLARAACAMQHPPQLAAFGTPINNVGGGMGGNEIIHQDLKPSNGRTVNLDKI